MIKCIKKKYHTQDARTLSVSVHVLFHSSPKVMSGFHGKINDNLIDKVVVSQSFSSMIWWQPFKA